MVTLMAARKLILFTRISIREGLARLEVMKRTRWVLDQRPRLMIRFVELIPLVETC